MGKLIITAAVNGGITLHSKNPAVPYTPEEITNAVYEVWNAGASVAHIHARNLEGTPSYCCLIAQSSGRRRSQRRTYGSLISKL